MEILTGNALMEDDQTPRVEADDSMSMVITMAKDRR